MLLLLFKMLLLAKLAYLILTYTHSDCGAAAAAALEEANNRLVSRRLIHAAAAFEYPPSKWTGYNNSGNSL